MDNIDSNIILACKGHFDSKTASLSERNNERIDVLRKLYAKLFAVDVELVTIKDLICLLLGVVREYIADGRASKLNYDLIHISAPDQVWQVGYYNTKDGFSNSSEIYNHYKAMLLVMVSFISLTDVESFTEKIGKVDKSLIK